MTISHLTLTKDTCLNVNETIDFTYLRGTIIEVFSYRIMSIFSRFKHCSIHVLIRHGKFSPDFEMNYSPPTASNVTDVIMTKSIQRGPFQVSSHIHISLLSIQEPKQKAIVWMICKVVLPYLTYCFINFHYYWWHSE